MTDCQNNTERFGSFIWKSRLSRKMRSIPNQTSGKGYRNVSIEGIQNIWNANRWTEIPDDAFNTQDDKHLIHFTFFESGGGDSGASDTFK